MKKYYKYGELILALREEYQECKNLLEELNGCINIKSDNSNFYFTGSLPGDYGNQDLNDRKIRLFVEKRYLDILKKIQNLRYNWSGKFLYSAFFSVNKKDNGLYEIKYDNLLTTIDRKKYIPEVEIINQVKFSELIDELFSVDLMQLKQGYFFHNFDSISLDFDYADISTTLGDTFINWSGIDDTFMYIMRKDRNPAPTIEDILTLEMPADKISPEWLKLLEKHENDFDDDLYFKVDKDFQKRQGFLQISDIENKKLVKLLIKEKQKTIF